MLIRECVGCKYFVNLIALGQGPRCSNKEYQKSNELETVLPVVISEIKNCELYTKQTNRE
jgi:hypothetical protein